MNSHCPVCRGSDARRFPYDNHQKRLSLNSLRHQAGGCLFTAGLRMPWLRNRLLFSPTRDIRQCQDCGHGIYDRAFKPGELEAYYRHRYFLADGLPPERWDDSSFVTEHAKSRGQWAFVSPYLEQFAQPRMLDVGAAASRISRLARLHLGGRAQCSVVEPGEGWAEYYKHHGIRVAGRFFPCADDQSYDYIHTSHWLEHVEALEPVLSGLRARMAPGGFCFIEVPNCDAIYFAGDFPDTPHIHFFTASSLERSMADHGFVAVDVRECGLPNASYLRYRRFADRMSVEELRTAEESEASIEHIPGGNLLRGLFRAV